MPAIVTRIIARDTRPGAAPDATVPVLDHNGPQRAHGAPAPAPTPRHADLPPARRAPGVTTIRAVTVLRHRSRGDVAIGHASGEAAVCYAVALLTGREASGQRTYTSGRVYAGRSLVGRALTVAPAPAGRVAAVVAAAARWPRVKRDRVVADAHVATWCRAARSYAARTARQVQASERLEAMARRKREAAAAVAAYNVAQLASEHEAAAKLARAEARFEAWRAKRAAAAAVAS